MISLRVVLSALVLAPLLGGCAADLVEHDYRLAHPITVEEKAAVALFSRPAEGASLSPADRDRLGRLAEESLRRGAGAIEVSVGAKAGEEAAALGFAQTLADTLRAWGVGAVTVAVAGGPDSALQPGQAQVRVPVWEAKAPECGTFERGLNPDYSNAPNSNWGCSLQRNRALMVQNPADLVRARETSGRDGGRAATVLEKYGKGEATGAAKEATSAGSTSSVGSSAGAK
ncbi:putative Type IV pili component(Pilus biogenesis CpaD-related,10-203) [Magnetospirillum sp. XM-1]|uniref:CpaD family pilus assembly protein n=1 Tax=Magnetospirillum sp. XM-1 TaxID=1663591 RepID=UPI00073DC840|nr:CpaD family pilus assembly protein [Magnetospirillum sp. XM-1]CUW38429.1 putative Type IV pili component(Pilus biogenesis CpaD-related,10-203) [Magnetospirillum sp. XM-1]